MEFIVNLAFKNKAATPKTTIVLCDRLSVAQIMEWYGAYHAGDNYKVWLDGELVPKDQDGCPINPII